jgi:hypothetical protein
VTVYLKVYNSGACRGVSRSTRGFGPRVSGIGEGFRNSCRVVDKGPRWRQLHAARLSGKRLLAPWNALPGVERRRKVGDREGLIDQLWSAIETDCLLEGRCQINGDKRERYQAEQTVTLP